MRLAGFLFLLSLMGFQTSAPTQDAWIRDGARLCTFNANIGKPPTRCVQYHKMIAHKFKDGQVWNEFQFLWKDSQFEVKYKSRIGSLGISEFTIGEIAYRNVGSSKYTENHAASYAANREELIIGIPDEGYRFSMEGAI